MNALLDQAAIALERLDLMAGRARDAARAETEGLRTALLTSLGHDLRTPLTSVRGALETLRTVGTGLSPEARADLLEVAEEETARLGRYIANILEMVRIENGEIRPRREPVDVTEALEAVAARLSRATGRAIATAIEPHLPQPRLDAVLLDGVLGNLLDNALKFSGPEGRVTVTARRAGPEVVIGVEDDGPGIPTEDLHRVFDPFHRVGRTDRITAGTGLGLAICRGLVHAMGGRIAAESPIGAGGRGTRMTLRFPS
ncbi:sensor histidine kinase [Roseomonas sp. CCTCC AB2023176]|uniref:sensor histidine kinase n=1 Tax=Roseomonas sp. CCTCC AB2023176 TaxID=3342640 RepID=UPI0035D684F6